METLPQFRPASPFLFHYCLQILLPPFICMPSKFIPPVVFRVTCLKAYVTMNHSSNRINI